MALDDLTVLDIATLAAAPQIAAFFGDFGARVVKVEPPAGDPLRRLVDTWDRPLQFMLVNRNKACVTLDLGRPDGRALLERMLARADLLVSALPPARLAAWDLAPAALRARHPRLVAVNLTTFGTEGPWHDRPGSGTLAEAATGLAHLTGMPDGPPTLAPVGLGDHLGVLEGIIAALVGLYERERGTPAPAFDIAMTDALLRLMGPRLALVARSGVDPGRCGNRFPTMAPRNTYPTADGRWVAITAGTDDMVARLLAAIGRPELAGDPRFATNRARVEHADALDAIVGAWIAARGRDEVVGVLARARVSAAGVDDLHEVLRNPHFWQRGAFVRSSIGTTVVGPLPLRAEAPGAIRWFGRERVGEDNAAVYGEWLGLPDEELRRLRADGVI